jgi:acetate kinase
MKNLVLAFNCGSSSVKASILRDQECILHVLGERLETDQSTIHIRFVGEDEINIVELNINHARVLEEIIFVLKDRSLLEHVFAVGHRVVPGAPRSINLPLSPPKTLRESTAFRI